MKQHSMIRLAAAPNRPLRFAAAPRALAAAALLGLGMAPAIAQTRAAATTADGIAEYRALLAEGNPAELWEAKGEGLWKQKRGPKGATLEACDLGKGPGVVKGAFVELPRHFADTGRVQDLAPIGAESLEEWPEGRECRDKDQCRADHRVPQQRPRVVPFVRDADADAHRGDHQDRRGQESP